MLGEKGFAKSRGEGRPRELPNYLESTVHGQKTTTTHHTELGIYTCQECSERKCVKLQTGSCCGGSGTGQSFTCYAIFFCIISIFILLA